MCRQQQQVGHFGGKSAFTWQAFCSSLTTRKGFGFWYWLRFEKVSGNGVKLKKFELWQHQLKCCRLVGRQRSPRRKTMARPAQSGFTADHVKAALRFVCLNIIHCIVFCVSSALLFDTFSKQPPDHTLTLNLQKWLTCCWWQHISIHYSQGHLGAAETLWTAFKFIWQTY